MPSSKSRLFTCLIGKKELLCTQCRGTGHHLSASGKCHGFLELRREAGVCSRVMAGVAIKNFCLFIDVRTPVSLRCTPQESKLHLADKTEASGGEAGDRGSLSSWNSDIAIPIHFQEESGIVTFEALNPCAFRGVKVM